MVDFVCVSSRTLWIKFKSSRVKDSVVVGYGLMFWNNIDRNLDSIGNGYRLCILGDVNG